MELLAQVWQRVYLEMAIIDSISGLDADATGHLSFKGFPDLPVATCKPRFTAGQQIAANVIKILVMDSEELGPAGSESQLTPKDLFSVTTIHSGLVMSMVGISATDFVIDSKPYLRSSGPYIYQFSSKGEMIGAIRPPDAFIPVRNGSER